MQGEKQKRRRQRGLAAAKDDEKPTANESTLIRVYSRFNFDCIPLPSSRPAPIATRIVAAGSLPAFR